MLLGTYSDVIPNISVPSSSAKLAAGVLVVELGEAPGTPSRFFLFARIQDVTASLVAVGLPESVREGMSGWSSLGCPN